MTKTNLSLLIACALLLAAAFGCNFSASTANLSDLKIGKDKAVTSETTTFGPNDTMYAVGTVANAPGKVKVKGQLAFEDVAGQTAGPIPGLEKTLDLDGSGTATYTFTPPPDGWPKGKYKIEVTLMDESGAQKGQRSSTVTIQ